MSQVRSGRRDFESVGICTPNTGRASLGSVASGGFTESHGFGASTSAHRRWRWIEFSCTFLGTFGEPRMLKQSETGADGMHSEVPLTV
jgi:hypothetical protein